MERSQGWGAGPQAGLSGSDGGGEEGPRCDIGEEPSLLPAGQARNLGPGSRAAAERTQNTLTLEERHRRERQAFELGNLGREMTWLHSLLICKTFRHSIVHLTERLNILLYIK